MTEEQRELLRQCAQRVIDNKASGRVIDPETLEWAEGVVAAVAPLDKPLGNGAPARGLS